MITVKRGQDTTEVNLDGELGTLMLETISVVESIGNHIADNVENYEEVIFHWVDELIGAAYGKH